MVCFVSAVTTSDRDNSPATLQLVLLQVAAAATVRQRTHAITVRSDQPANDTQIQPSKPLPPVRRAFGPTEARVRAISHMGMDLLHPPMELSVDKVCVLGDKIVSGFFLAIALGAIKS